MKIKDLLLPFAFAFALSWMVQHFIINKWWGGAQNDKITEQAERVRKPLNREIDFVDAKRSTAAKQTVVETDWGRMLFSTDGASLEELSFKRIINGSEHVLNTIRSHTETEQEQRCFLVALQEKTPLYYRLVDHSEQDAHIKLTYQAATDECVVRKTFLIYKDLHKVDLKLSIDPKANSSIEPRIFYQAPLMAEGRGDKAGWIGRGPGDSVSAIAIDNAGSFEKISHSSLSGSRYSLYNVTQSSFSDEKDEKSWFAPHMFGADSRYFIHALINDGQRFVQRAYYRQGGATLLSAIIEGPTVQKQAEWTLSFYMGPKESGAIVAVDPRLEQTFEYSGIFAPISKLLLKFLNLLFGYVGNYGFAIILLTLLIKLLLMPFTFKSEKSQRNQKEVQKKLAYLQKRYKDDPETLAREKTEVIRKYGMPGIGGCLPLLLQIPIFIALSRVLYSAIELYKAPMLWIPDLSATDPYYILPLLLALSMLMQAATADAQQRLFMIALALVFGAMAASFSAGLALYIFMSTLLGVLQTSLFKYVKVAK